MIVKCTVCEKDLDTHSDNIYYVGGNKERRGWPACEGCRNKHWRKEQQDAAEWREYLKAVEQREDSRRRDELAELERMGIEPPRTGE
jgi:hypothetical protein